MLEHTSQRIQHRIEQLPGGFHLGRERQAIAVIEKDGWEYDSAIVISPVNVILVFKRPADPMIDFEHKPEVHSVMKGSPPVNGKRLVAPLPIGAEAMRRVNGNGR